MHDLDTDVDVLSGWVARRERQYRALTTAWVGLTAACGLLALMTDEALFVPVLPVVVAAVWLAAAWGTDRWWGLRSHWAGHPVVRADVPWTLAASRPLPAGWPESPVNGSLHLTPDGWVWHPSRLVAADLPVRFWPSDDVAAVTVTPLRAPLLPPSAQLRLYLRGGGSVEIVVRRPVRLGYPVG